MIDINSLLEDIKFIINKAKIFCSDEQKYFIYDNVYFYIKKLNNNEYVWRIGITTSTVMWESNTFKSLQEIKENLIQSIIKNIDILINTEDYLCKVMEIISKQPKAGILNLEPTLASK